ncbi:hypothetical protein, partial [Fusobacterium russii]|uniref:hypothetical protein n=1 Tax=Fusobacterium russii TaxID=854 RepID=UPI0003B3689B
MKEKIEKMLKSHLKRKLTITTATLIAFLLSSNLAVAGQNYQVGNNGIKRDDSGTWEDAKEYLKKTDLFKIGDSTIENRLKDYSYFNLLAEVNKTFINKGAIQYLENKGTGKIENRAHITQINSKTESKIDNLGYINTIESNGNIFNKAFIHVLKGITIENEGIIYILNENKKVKNYGLISRVVSGKVANTEKIDNYGIINFEDTADYNILNGAGKLDNKGIVINDLNNFTASGNTDDKGRAIKNYKNQAIADTKITNGILNTYKGTVNKDLTLNNNSIFNMREGTIEADKKLSFNNSTANIVAVGFKNGTELEFKNNSTIGEIYINANNLKNLTIDNTTVVGDIDINGNVETINLVPNKSNVNRILRINDFYTDRDKKINTNISTNVDLLGRTDIGNITVESDGRLTIANGALLWNGKKAGKLYKKDIKIENGGKILVGVDPYNIGIVEELGEGNNLTDSVKGQNDPDKTSERLAQDKLNIDADSLLHDIVIMPEEEIIYEKGLPSEYKAKVRNKYKVIEIPELPKKDPDKPSKPGTPKKPDKPSKPGTPKKPEQKLVWDYDYLNAVYLSLLDADKIKYFSVYSDNELDGFYSYLRDIYANNPYTVTAETSFRNLSMLRDNAYLDLKPNLKRWAVMGGLSHSDRENKYKMSTTEVDTKTTGAYAKGEYGLKEDTTLGLILGGTNSKSDLSTGRVKG